MRPAASHRRATNHVAPALLLACLPAAGTAAAEAPAELVRLPEPVGIARLVTPDGAAAPPLVIMLPDALGEDGKSDVYVDLLLARGIAALVLGLNEDLDADPTPVDPTAAPEAVWPAIAWAQAAGFDAARIGVMGFGLGGRAALAAAAGRPTVALYPGCIGLPLPAAGPALILQGGQAAGGCAGLPVRPGVELRLLPGAGHGWDAPGAIWPSPGPLLPDPGGGPPLSARADLAVTLEAAETIADWFEDRLLAGQRRAAR